MKARCPGTWLSFLLLVLSCLPATSSQGQEVLVIAHATVVDATSAAARTNVTIVITNRHISLVSEGMTGTSQAGARVVDASGKYLIPGLWDMHVHWYEKDYLSLFIANGVTGIRVMWGFPMHHEWRRESERDLLLAPRMLIASTLVDGPKPIWPGSKTAGTAAQGREAVGQAKQEGADFLKVYSELPREAYFAIAEEAKKQGIPFAGHVPVSVSALEAARSGQKSNEHLEGILQACSSREDELYKSARSKALALESYSPEKAQALFAEFHRQSFWQCPTLVVLRNSGNLDDPSITQDERLRFLPRQFKSTWDPSTDFRFKSLTPEDYAFRRKVFQQQLRMVGAMQQSGVGILAGTDVGNPYCFPGFSLHDELELLVKSGLTPMQALQAATLYPAIFMNRQKELGTVEPGKLADLILLDANPIENIGNTRRINAVIFGGRLFPKASIDEMLTKAERLANRISLAQPLMETIKEKNVEAAIEQYHTWKRTRAEDCNFAESELNILGYKLLEMKRAKDAIRILELNASVYPESANVYDSLGEAYLADGDSQLAAKNYRRSLELDPHNNNAATYLRRLEGQEAEKSSH